MPFTLGTDVFGAIDDGLDDLFTTGLQNFADLIAPVVGAFVSLYGVLIVLNYLWSGGTNNIPGDAMKRMFYMALFTAFAFNITLYKAAVVNPVNSIGSEISEAFAATGADAPQVIDQMGNQIDDTIKLVWDTAPDFSLMDMNIEPLWKAIQTIIIVGFFGTIFMVVSSLFLLIAKIMVSLVLLLGPLFISCTFFPSVREYFMKWLSQLFNYTLLFAMFGLTFTLLTNLLQMFVSGTNFSEPLVGDLTNLKLIFMYLLFSGVIVALPSLTSQLTGGVGINSFGAISPMASAATRGLSKMVSAFSKSGGGGGRGNSIGAGSPMGGNPNRRLG